MLNLDVLVYLHFNFIKSQQASFVHHKESNRSFCTVKSFCRHTFYYSCKIKGIVFRLKSVQVQPRSLTTYNFAF